MVEAFSSSNEVVQKIDEKIQDTLGFSIGTHYVFGTWFDEKIKARQLIKGVDYIETSRNYYFLNGLLPFVNPILRYRFRISVKNKKTLQKASGDIINIENKHASLRIMHDNPLAKSFRKGRVADEGGEGSVRDSNGGGVSVKSGSSGVNQAEAVEKNKKEKGKGKGGDEEEGGEEGEEGGWVGGSGDGEEENDKEIIVEAAFKAMNQQFNS